MVGVLKLTLQFIALLCMSCLLSFCSLRQRKESPQLQVSEGLDTIWIRKERQHGYYLINDTLTIFSGWYLIDEELCATLDHRSEPDWTWDKSPYKCRVSDLYPPFQVFKIEWSDTLHVFKDGKHYRFKME
jgi:hypothetical protein